MDINKFILIVVSIFLTVGVGIGMKIFGKYTFASIFLTLFVVWLIIGLIYLLYWYFILRLKPIVSNEFELDPEEAYRIAVRDLQRDEGLVEGKRERLNTIAVGDEKESHNYLIWIFRDRYTENRVAYYRNLKKIQIKGLMYDENNDPKFNKDVLEQVKMTMLPKQETGTYRKVWRDPQTGEILREEEGTNLPSVVVQEQEKKDNVEVTAG